MGNVSNIDFPRSERMRRVVAERIQLKIHFCSEEQHCLYGLFELGHCFPFPSFRVDLNWLPSRDFLSYSLPISNQRAIKAFCTA